MSKRAKTSRPYKPCLYPGCGQLTDSKESRCEKHLKIPWDKSGGQPDRIRGHTLQRLRRQLFQEQPLCVLCLQQGRVSLATQRDHIVSLEEGGKDEVGNTQGLCRGCHDLKSLGERQRARGASVGRQKGAA